MQLKQAEEFGACTYRWCNFSFYEFSKQAGEQRIVIVEHTIVFLNFHLKDNTLFTFATCNLSSKTFQIRKLFN